MATGSEALGRARHIAALLSRAGAIEVLLRLHHRGETRMKELLKVEGSEASVVRRVRELTDGGFIERRVLEDRSTRYVLTSAGRDLVAVAQKMESVGE